MTWDDLQSLLNTTPLVRDLPIASDSRTELARSQMSECGTAEEYAARNAQDWGAWSFGEYAYEDPELDAWIHRLERIFSTAGAVDACRRHFLTDAERLTAEAREREAF